MKSVLLAACCLLMVPMSSRAQKSRKAMGDQEFVDFAAQTDMVEANLGQLAQDVASAQPVKDYGQMLDTDHTKDYQLLQDAAGKANLKVPDAINEEHNKTLIGPMHKLKGAAFDHRYISEMIAGHTRAIEVYKAEAADGKNSDLKSYAEDALPVLEKHLDAAKKLENTKAAAK
jgi:putative membrane protein